MIGNVVAGSNDIGYLHPAPWNVKYSVEDVTVGLRSMGVMVICLFWPDFTSFFFWGGGGRGFHNKEIGEANLVRGEM